jgi:hypothetical protein
MKKWAVLTALIVFGYQIPFIVQQAQADEIEKDRTSWESNRQEVEKLAQVGKALVFKKLYIGMSIYEAAEILRGYFKTNAFQVQKFNDDDLKIMASKSDGYIVGDHQSFISNYELGTFDYGKTLILAHEDKKVALIFLPSDAVDELFNSKGIETEEFVKKFIEAYQLDTFKPFNEQGKIGWKYNSPYGFAVDIYNDKSLMVTKIAAEKDLKFN